MTVSFVLRLLPGLAPGEFAGEIETVHTGDKTVVRNVDELLAFLRRALEGEQPDVAISD